MKSLGSYFRRKREEKDLSVEDVADETNIAPRFIEAIEDQDFSQFPADVYAKGFIRTYARFLGLDAQSLLMEYSLNHEEVGGSDLTSGSTKLLYWLTMVVSISLVILVILLRFAWMHPRQETENQAINQRTGMREPLGEMVKQPENEIEVPDKAKSLQLRVVAESKTWVYAIFDGMKKKEYMFQPGDETLWEAEDTIRLRLGNAGGLQFYFNGKKLPKLGESGEVADKIITLQDGSIKVKSPGR